MWHLIHKSQSPCEAGAVDPRAKAPSTLWTRFVTFDLPSFASPASFTQRSHSMDLRYDTKEKSQGYNQTIGQKLKAEFPVSSGIENPKNKGRTIKQEART